MDGVTRAGDTRPVHGSHGPLSRKPDPRVLAALVSLGGGAIILVVKFVGFWLTDSQAVFSDAAESIVNVLASAAALTAVYVSSQPADENHPYGHGKAEHLTGGFEGGLIAFAAVVIIHEAVNALLNERTPHDLHIGMAVIGGAGIANLALGGYLLRVGRRHGSPALVADGLHVLSDFWTSAGAIVGLALVWLTGLWWIDAVTALLVAVNLLWTGMKLIRTATRGLMDETDPEVVADLAQALEAAREPGVIEIHELRAISLGGYHHVDAHVVVPEFWTVHEAHDAMDAYEARVLAVRKRPGEVQFHVDPCERAYCRFCDLPECPERLEPFVEHRPFTPDRAVTGPKPAPDRHVHDGDESS